MSSEQAPKKVVAPGRAIREEAEARANEADKEIILQRLRDAVEALNDAAQLINQTSPEVCEEVRKDERRLINKAIDQSVNIGQTIDSPAREWRSRGKR